MMKILGIETSTSTCGIAILEDNRVLCNVILDIGNVHDEKLLQMISFSLSSINQNLSEMDGIAVSNGPGSFTGLRIGLSVAKGLAISSGKPLVGIPTLDALAHHFNKNFNFSNDENFQLCPAMDAKRDEVYYSVYQCKNSKLNRLSEYLCESIDIILDKIDYPTIIFGEGAAKFNDSRNRNENVMLLDSVKNDAKSVAVLGYQRINNKDYDDIDSLEPIYIKEFKVINNNSGE